MNVLQKGGLTVVLATIITSALIILTGTSTAENNKANVLTSSPEKNLKNLSVAESADKTEGSIVVDQQIQEAELVPPPPGPFFGNAGTPKVEKKILASPKSPKAPKLPVLKAVVIDTPPKLIGPKTIAPIVKKPQIEFKPMVPTLDPKVALSIVAPTIPKKTIVAPKIEGLLGKSLSEPSFNKVVPTVSAQVLSQPHFQKKINKAPLVNEKPIWMQKAPEAPILTIEQPQKIQDKGFENNTHSNEHKLIPQPPRYMYMPAPMIAPNYAHPQLPMYGGYYYAPAPQPFMMPPVNYGNSVIQNNQQQQGNAK